MPAPAIGVRPRWTPGPSAQIDWSHPIAQGLVGCVLPGIGIDLDGQTVTRFGSSVAPTASSWGRAAGSFAGTSGLQVGQTGTPIVGDSATFTITGAVHGIPTANPAGSAHPIYAERGLSANNPICKLEYATVTASRLGIAYRDNAGTLLNAAGSGSFNDGLPHVFSLVRSSLTDFALWADGRRDSTHTSGTMTASFSNVNIECRIGCDKGDTTGAFPGTVALVVLHRRALTDAELAMLHADPFCFLTY